jgi:hypothetical protein
MRARWMAVLTVVASVTASNGQTSLPGDIHPETLSRLPPVQRDALDAEGRRIWDLIAGPSGTLPRTGPAQISMHSPHVAEPMHMLNQYLRRSPIGSRYFELAALVAAREFEQAYEWSSHEPAGLRAGLEQSVIDVVKYDRDVQGLQEKDATVIRLGRALLRDKQVSPELWAKTVELFGIQGAFDVTAVIADYVLAGIMLTAVDQQLPPDRKPLLPPR